MPTYAYACTACEHRFEIFQSFTEDSLTACPQCRGRLRKLFNAVGVVFKGSGFYSNDYRKPGYSEAAKKDTGPAKESTAAKTPEPKKPASKD